MSDNDELNNEEQPSQQEDEVYGDENNAEEQEEVYKNNHDLIGVEGIIRA